MVTSSMAECYTNSNSTISGSTNSSCGCNSFQYSGAISGSLGFLFLGNCYDNSLQPRNIVLTLMIILSVLTLVEAILTSTINSFGNTTNSLTKVKVEVTIILYQLSSIFEAGVSVACIVTLHNWFNESILGTVSSVWLSAIYLQ